MFTQTNSHGTAVRTDRARVLGIGVAVPSWTPFVSFDHGSQVIGATDRRKGLEYGAIEVSTSPDAYDMVQSEALVRAREAASRR